MRDAPVVIIVEDDVAIRRSLQDLMASAGLDAMAFSSGAELLGQVPPDAVCCLVLDVRLPQGNGFDVHAELKAQGREMPAIFITGYGDVPMSVRAMKSGAVDFLQKPFRDQDILDAIHSALDQDRRRRRLTSAKGAALAKFATLTKREQQVFLMVTEGLLNKQIADRLGISQNTVKLHRGNVMGKMQVRSLAQLFRIAVEMDT